MLRDLNNPKEFMFVNEDALSDSSGHKSSAPIELWGDDAFVPIRQKMLNQHLKNIKV